MASEIDLNDPFLKLLTDALRAGPGSPEWHQAVAKLRDSGAVNGQSVGSKADEYKMLIAAREYLESGKEYRSVRAGPGFTRKLMHGIENESEGGKPPGLPTAAIIGTISGLVILAIILVVAWRMVPRTTVETPRTTVEDLFRARTEMMNEIAGAKFDGTDAAIPDSWKTIGGLQLEVSKGLHPSANAGSSDSTTTPTVIGGGVVAPGSISPDESFVAETYLRLEKPSDKILFEFFVSTDSNFSPDRATSTSDLVWLLQGSRQKVIISGREQADAQRPEPAKESAKDPARELAGQAAAPVPVRILMNRDSAIVEYDGQRLWAGPNGLPASPRYVGVRFLVTGPKGTAPANVVSVRVMKK